MSKPRFTSPASPRAVRSAADVSFKPHHDGSIRRVGSVAPKKLPVNGPSGVKYDKATYINK